MINVNTQKQVMPLATLAASKGYALGAGSGTPLDQLNNALLSGWIRCVSDDEKAAIERINDSYAELKPESCTRHTELMDAFIKDIAAATQNHIAYARTVVSPAVTAFMEAIVAKMGEKEDVASRYKVSTRTLPLPMQNFAFRDSLQDYDGGVYAAPESYLHLQPLQTAEIIELLQTGSKEVDKALELWLVSIGESQLQHVWTSLFTGEGADRDFISMLEDEKYGVDNAIIVYLLARRLFDNIPENAGMGLVQYQTICSQYRDAAVQRMLQAYEHDDNLQQGQIFMIRTSADKREVILFEPVYRQFLQDGGSVEVVLGALAQGTMLYTLEQAKEKQLECLQAWDSYVSYTNVAAANKRFNEFREVVTAAYNEAFAQASQEEKEVVLTMPGYDEKIQQLLEQEVSMLRSGDMDNLADLATRIICRVRFYYNDAELILTGINRVMAQNSKMDIREAALIAATEYVGDYVADQIQVLEFL